MIMAANKIIKNKKGQALFEFLIFLPFMLMMYSVTLSMSNAISASINQQKVVRGYFYFKVAGNSTIPAPINTGQDTFANFRNFGMHAYGWMEKLDGRTPVAPCFKFNLLLGEDEEDECEESYSEPTTQFIRVMTAYGVCGATYSRGENSDPQAYPLVDTSGAAATRCYLIQ